MVTEKEKLTILVKKDTAKQLRIIKKQVGASMGFTIEKALKKTGVIEGK